MLKRLSLPQRKRQTTGTLKNDGILTVSDDYDMRRAGGEIVRIPVNVITDSRNPEKSVTMGRNTQNRDLLA